MSDELRLPDELAAFEAMLAAKSLSTTGIDRDQLMYRAGWAACESQFYSPLSKEGARGGISNRRRTMAWSCASAALAASIAVALTLGWSQMEKNTLAEAEHAGGGTPRLAVEESPSAGTVNEAYSKPAAATRFALYDLDRLTDARIGRTLHAGPWLSMQRLDRHLPVGSQPERFAAENKTAPAAPKTVRDLQHELLPNEPPRPSVIWPWVQTNPGETI